uniref:EOG090X04W0 n=1 Tax=Evadne anonyx TaxID=141404 RepID=A0A9N6ZEY6_9CRUS|nr:EOG090X04W0 [Evadne anonyx]
MGPLFTAAFASVLFGIASAVTFHIQTDEVFTIPLSPATFNLSDAEYTTESYSYSASIHGLPDLPKWIHMTYNRAFNMGFLYGTPPNLESTVKLDLVALNLLTFDSPTQEITLEITQKQVPARRQIKLKIHNINIEDLMDQQKISHLLDVFRIVLWPESAHDLHLVELQSAILAGDRHPVRPEDGEGVILTLGSHAEFSNTLRGLEREVSPLWSFRPCPRNFKKTSVERYFYLKGFILDWCSFHLVPQNSSLVTLSTTARSALDSKTERVILESYQNNWDDERLWRAPSKSETLIRSYAADGVIAIFVPIVILLILVGVLTAILGVHPEGKEPEEGFLYEAVFEELPFLHTKEKATTVEKEEMLEMNRRLNRSGHSVTPPLKRNNPLFDSLAESTTLDSSPFLMSSTSPSPTPASTLSRSAYPTLRSTLNRSERSSTLGRPEPPPYYGGAK